jgi:cyclase
MKLVRIIPRLDIKGPNLVKGIHLEGLRVLGKPANFAKYYYENGADELLFMDVVASLYNRNNLHDIITETAQNIFIPITVGGGIRSLNDIKKILRTGADKVTINTEAIKRSDFIKEAANEFGSSTIVVTIEAIKNPDGSYNACMDNGREYTNLNVIEWAQNIEHLGAGEIIITSINKEGTGKGLDIDLIKAVSDAVSIPVVAHGGIGSLEDVQNAIFNENIDSIAIASALHYSALTKFKMNDFEEGNIDFLKSGNSNTKVNSFDLKELKDKLNISSINCRRI